MTDYKAAVAQALLDIEAIKLQPNDPFTWASGLKSPIYTDNRKTIAFPKVRKLIAKGLANLIKHENQKSKLSAAWPRPAFHTQLGWQLN